MLNKIDRAKDTLPIYKLAMDNAPTEMHQKDLRAQYLRTLLTVAETTPAGAERENMIKQAEEIANKMVWVQDSFFGDAINGLAYCKMLRGDVKGAQELIQDYLELLMQIHEQIREEDPDGRLGILRTSPLPQCRYLIGKMLYDQAKIELAKGSSANDDTIKNLFLGERDPSTKKRNQQGAFNHLVNVYVNYPESQSASLAGDLVEDINKITISRYGTDLMAAAKISPEQKAKVRQQQFVQANIAFDAGDWDNAIAAYTKTISQYGLSKDALPAITKMIEASIRGGVKDGQLDPYNKLQAETLTAALAEGFSGVKELYTMAGDQLRKISDLYGELKLNAMKDSANALFFKYYPKHASAVAMQKKIADEKAAAGDAEGAEKLYIAIRDAATSEDQRDVRTAVLAALVKLYEPNGANPDVTKELAAAKAFSEHFANIARPGVNAASAEFKLADAYRHQGEALRKAVKDSSNDKKIAACYAQATKIYNALATELAKADSKYVTASTERKNADQLLEGALFQRGVCIQRLPAGGDAKKEAAYKAKAKTFFEDYLKKFPKGLYAPRSILQIGTIQAASGDIEGSRATLDKLRKSFPQSEEAKNSIPMLADALFQMGMKGEATNTYKQMFAAGGTYTPAQYQAAAEKLLDAGDAKLAIEACDCIMKAQNSKAYLPKAMLLRTKALLADKQAENAYKQVTELLEKYGNTTMAVDANHVLLEVIGAQILNTKTFEERNELIGKAKKAVTFLSAQATRKAGDNAAAADAENTRLNLAVAEVARQAYEAEKKANSDRVITAIGSALNAYRSAMFAGATPVTDPLVAPNVQKAYKGYIELTRERASMATGEEKQDFLRDVADLGAEYLDKFPNGIYKTDVINAVSQAKIELGE
jgi:TolA-binding protein